MPDKSRPPSCFLCSKNYEETLNMLHYCICDIGICDNCINSVKNSDTTWICPNCKAENSIEETKLIRS
ncbi:MAG: hypothetical protein ACFFBP_15085 [Promethearchaeota archaeon]